MLFICNIAYIHRYSPMVKYNSFNFSEYNISDILKTISQVSSTLGISRTLGEIFYKKKDCIVSYQGSNKDRIIFSRLPWRNIHYRNVFQTIQKSIFMSLNTFLIELTLCTIYAKIIVIQLVSILNLLMLWEIWYLEILQYHRTF